MILPLLVALGIAGVGYWLVIQNQAPSTGGTQPTQTNPSDGETQPPQDFVDTGLIVSPAWQNMITTDINTWPTGDKVWDICRAIAQAEGYNTNGAAFHLNNPGDLSPGDEHGFSTAGPAELHDGSYIIHFANAVDGWNALYAKINNIVTGQSRVYDQHATVAQVASKYAGNSGAWANNVGRILGIDPNAQGFFDYVNS